MISFLVAIKLLKISSFLTVKPNFVNRLYSKLLDSLLVFVTNLYGILAFRSLYRSNKISLIYHYNTSLINYILFVKFSFIVIHYINRH